MTGHPRSLLPITRMPCTPVYGVLLEVIDGLHGEGTGGDPQTAAIAAWSLVHGLAALLIDRPLHALCSDIATIHWPKMSPGD